MSESTSPPLPEINPIVSGLSDFPDRLSPMVIKELRQGLRTKAFTSTFLLLQITLGIASLTATMAETGSVGGTLSGMIFGIFALVALIMQPLRGTNAVASEMKDQTLEIMSLTRLNSFRVVFGKWASLVSQTALLLVTVIPYLVMRYFFGGMQLFAELSLLMAIFILSACLTAVTVGLSCNQSIILRSILPVLGIPVLLSTLSGFVFGRMFFNFMDIFTFQDPDTNYGLLIFFLSAIYIGYFSLDLGVSRIAPLAENHTFRKRLIGLLTMAAALLACFLSGNEEAMIFLAIIFSCLIGVDASTEFPVVTPRIVRQYVKRGLLGRIIGFFFYPGWHTGVFLIGALLAITSLIVSTATTLAPALSSLDYDLKVYGYIFGIFHAIISPLLVVRLLSTKIGNLFTSYIIVLLVSIILNFLILMMASILDSESLLYLFSWMPASIILLAEEIGSSDGNAIFMIAVFLVYYLPLLALALKEYRFTRRLEKQVEARLSAQ